MRRTAAILILLGAATPSAAGPVELVGRYGFAGEWALSGTLAEENRGSLLARDYAGPVQLKHLAMCAPGEVSEKSGRIALSRLRAGQRYSAELTLAGETCRFAGTLSEDQVVFVSCGGASAIPLRLWLK